MDLSFFKPLFEIKSYTCAGVDGLISKIHLIAREEGTLKSEYIGIPIVIRAQIKKNKRN